MDEQNKSPQSPGVDSSRALKPADSNPTNPQMSSTTNSSESPTSSGSTPTVTTSSWNAPSNSVSENDTTPTSEKILKRSMGLFDNDTQESFGNKESVPVVRVWSIRGVEYAIMTFMLWAIAVGINWVLVALVNGEAGFVSLSPPVALLIVSLPIFAFFFIRLKKAELADQALKTESTKRKFSQITQIVSFIVLFISLLAIVASLLAAAGGESDDLGSTITSALMFILVWSGVFAYYWFDEHRN